jgi:hypothetical protein
MSPRQAVFATKGSGPSTVEKGLGIEARKISIRSATSPVCLMAGAEAGAVVAM